MSKYFLYALILLLAGFGALATAQTASFNRGGAALAAAPGSIGSTVADFKLNDANGKSHTLAEVKGTKGTVIIFISARCPMVRAYNDRIIKLASDFQSQGVNLIAINANYGESADEIKAHASSVHYNFPVLIDKGSKVANQMGAERTPETFLLDADNHIVYHGRIDNSAAPATATTSELRDAVNDVIAGRQVAKPETTAVGCSIKKAD